MSTSEQELAANVHRVLLTHHRELRFDHDGERYRVAYYVPQAPKKLLRELAARANRGELQAIERLRRLPRTRFTATDTDLRHAVAEAVAQLDERAKWTVANQVDLYASEMRWKPDMQ